VVVAGEAALFGGNVMEVGQVVPVGEQLVKLLPNGLPVLLQRT
jgi:hypothetical protein